MSHDSRSPHEKRGSSQRIDNPKRGSVKTNMHATKEQYIGAEDEAKKFNEAVSKRTNA
jgi:hypothetical protein